MLETYSKENVQEFAFVEIAYLSLKDGKKPLPFKDLLEKGVKLKGLSNKEVQENVAQFYTDLNIDGRFVCIGDNQWGLKVWYPVETSEEELATTVKPKRKKKKVKIVDDFDEYDDLDEDFDDLDEVDDEDEDEESDDFDDVVDDDFNDFDDSDDKVEVVAELDDEDTEEEDLEEEED
jgi:DNA-directed RNA polymerase subunit delta